MMYYSKITVDDNPKTISKSPLKNKTVNKNQTI